MIWCLAISLGVLIGSLIGLGLNLRRDRARILDALVARDGRPVGMLDLDLAIGMPIMFMPALHDLEHAGLVRRLGERPNVTFVITDRGRYVQRSDAKRTG